MYENIKVIASDIDDTITPAATDPNPYTVETVEKIRDKGILFGLASGRPVDDVMNKFSLWGIRKQFDFIIGWNGGELYDNNTQTKYQFNFLKKEWIKEIIEFMSEFDAGIHMYLPNIYLSSVETDRAWFSAYKNHRKFQSTNDLSDFYKKDNGGIMFRCKLSEMDRIHEKLKTLKDKEYVGFNTQPDLIEFSHKDSNKGYALLKYLDMYNIKPEDCMSFGDTSNDNEMLRVSYGVCMLNGSDDTKKLAKVITDRECKDDGFAHFIEDTLL